MPSTVDRKVLQADALLLQGRAYLNLPQTGNAALPQSGNAKDVLEEGIRLANFENDQHILVAQLNEYLGRAWAAQGRHRRAHSAFSVSATRYREGNEVEKAAAIDAEAARLGVDGGGGDALSADGSDL